MIDLMISHVNLNVISCKLTYVILIYFKVIYVIAIMDAMYLGHWALQELFMYEQHPKIAVTHAASSSRSLLTQNVPSCWG